MLSLEDLIYCFYWLADTSFNTVYIYIYIILYLFINGVFMRAQKQTSTHPALQFVRLRVNECNE